jgi:hypothetical protein
MKKITVIGICLGLSLLSACAPATPVSTTTPDLNPFRTEVAATVLAQVTQDLGRTPSASPIPSPTATPPPSEAPPTEADTSTPAQTDTVTPGPQETLVSGTPETTGTATTDLAEWVSQSIADGTVFEPGETFTIVWTLKNTGTSTWTPDYLLRYYSGNAFGAQQEIFLDRDVLPGDTIDIAINMKAPTALGEYRSDWVMANQSRSNFKEPIYLEITVARPATPTATATATPTLTRTPTATVTP